MEGAETRTAANPTATNSIRLANHDHLGKLITYLAAVEAKAAIWLVSDPRPEHVAAIAWLNASSSATFYMVKVEAVRIGASPAAPLFTLIVGPSEDAKEVGQTKREIAERYGIRKRWWTQLVERSAAISKLHAHITPGEYSWIGTSSGVRGLNLNYVVTQEECAAELYVDRGKDSDAENESIFDQLQANKDDIEKGFGGPLSWERLEGKRACRIRFTQTGGGYRSPEEKWPSIQDGIISAMNRLEQALRPYLKTLKLSS
jgi:hypothetical protein